MKTLQDFINESVQQVNESISKDELEKIADAVISVLSNWENDDYGWDKRFNAYKELSQNNWEDILEYYSGWEDLYDELTCLFVSNHIKFTRLLFHNKFIF